MGSTVLDSNYKRENETNESSQIEEPLMYVNIPGFGKFPKQLARVNKSKILIFFIVLALTVILAPSGFSTSRSHSAGTGNIMFLAKRNLDQESKNKIYLRQIYHQEKPDEESLEGYFYAKRSNGLEFKDTDDFYRIKKSNVEGDIVEKRSGTYKRSFTGLRKIPKISNLKFTIKTSTANNKEQEKENSSNINNNSSNYRNTPSQSQTNDLEDIDQVGRGPSQIIAETELTKIGNEFRSSKYGNEASFWKTPDKSDRSVYQQAFNWASQLVQSVIPQKPNKEEPKSGWKYQVKDKIKVPDVSDKETLLSLARMSLNAFETTNSTAWEYLGKNWQTKSSFGWNSTGLRGYVFASEKNDTVVVSFKGTTSSFFKAGAGLTSENDRINDNRLFSCCCAHGSLSFVSACRCFVGGNSCNTTCLENSVKDKNTYILSASKIVKDVIKNYPKSNIVLTGNSLGASIASLTGLNFGLPAVAFGSPGDLLAAKRLKLPLPKKSEYTNLPIYHIGHTADPIFLGKCGPGSPCFLAGYSIESKCHIGNECIFDTVKYLGWTQDILHHRISEVINFILKPWHTKIVNATIPSCTPNTECSDCLGWKFV